MDIQRLTIGQMAELNHTTRQALRHYDAEGLLRPYVTDPDTGYRYYHINQSARLDMIQHLRACGYPLQKIKRQLEETDPLRIQALLLEQREAIDASMEQLLENRRAVDRNVENLARYLALPKNATIFLEHIPVRRIFRHVSSMNFFEQDDAGYELMLRALKQSLLEKRLPPSSFCNVGTIIRQDSIARGELYSNEVFVFLDDAAVTGRDIATELLPGGMHIALCAEDFLQEAAYARALLQEIQEKGYTIRGDYICEVVAEFPVFDQAPRRMFYKVQIPITLSL